MLEVLAVPEVTSRGEWEVSNKGNYYPKSKGEVKEGRDQKNPKRWQDWKMSLGQGPTLPFP